MQISEVVAVRPEISSLKIAVVCPPTRMNHEPETANALLTSIGSLLSEKFSFKKSS